MANDPAPKIQAPTKQWDEMTDDEKKAEAARLAKAEAVADKPDPEFDRFVDAKLVASMKRVFGSQKKYPVMLFQITNAMKAEGQHELPPRECGINGYNFVVPRGVPLMLPEGLVRNLHQAGEINDMTMVQLGLITMEEAAQNMKISREDAEKLSKLGKLM